MTQKESIMLHLGVDEQTAEQLIADDKAIDRGERMPFDLTPEQEKLARKSHRGESKKPRVYNFDTRKRKENTTKSGIIADLGQFLAEKVENLEIINPEREISFSLEGKSFSLTLTQHRKQPLQSAKAARPGEFFKNFSKNIKKMLDKWVFVCYNNYTEKTKER